MHACVPQTRSARASREERPGLHARESGGGGRGPAFPDTGSPLPWDRERPPCPAQPGPPPREPGPCQGAGNAEGARGHRPLRGPKGPPHHPAPAATCLPWITPGLGAPRTPPSGLRPPDDPACTPRPLSGPHPGPAAGHVASGPEPLTAPGPPRRQRLRAGGGWSRRHRERAGPGQPSRSVPPPASPTRLLCCHCGSILRMAASVPPRVLARRLQFLPCGRGLLRAQGGVSARLGP